MFSCDNLVAVEDAAFLVAAGRIKGALVLRATVGKPLGIRMLLIQPALGPFSRDSKIYDFRHPFTRWPLPTHGSVLETYVTALNGQCEASFWYIGKDYGEISIHG